MIDTVNDEELTGQRKELFKAINIRDANNKTLIVSNPIDVSFLPGGEKAYVLFSGSEDLMVFDMRRGGNAVQLVRRVPGDNPRGMVMSPDGLTLYIHNAMSHDLAVLQTGEPRAMRHSLPAEVQKMFDALDAFLKYDRQIPVPRSPYKNSDGTLTALATDGREAFNKAGCMTCHAGSAYTDSNLALDAYGKLNISNTSFLHDAGTANPTNKESAGDLRGEMKNARKQGEFDTPSLLGVYARAPYFHDGSAKTLEEVLQKPGVHRDQAQQLTEEERKALIEFLRELD